MRRILNLANQQKPFFTVNPQLVTDQINLWKCHLPNIQPHYAVKCNNDDYLLRNLAINDINFDCASVGEIKQILNLGIESDRIIYANPYKSQSAIDYAINNKVPVTVVDSIEELIFPAFFKFDSKSWAVTTKVASNFEDNSSYSISAYAK